MKPLHLEMVRVTEAAATAASTQVGLGDKIAADHAAVTAMRQRLNKISFAGKIVIGEGKKDDAPGLFTGEKVGAAWMVGTVPASFHPDQPSHTNQDVYDIAVDPLDGTTQTAKGGYEAMSVMAMGNENSLLESEGWYMNKLAVGPDIARRIKLDIREDIEDIIRKVSLAIAKDVRRVTACVLDRPRHENLIKRLRALGCRIKLIQDCDVSAAIATAIVDSGIDIYVGVGGAPEGVIGAAALKCLRGDFQGIMCDKDGKYDSGSQVYQIEDLAKGDVIFCATGVTDGSLLKGVRWTSSGPCTHSLLMRSESGTVRWITACHGN
jgi:fructose-1,6-bisphosphatase II / sedoheptulose-1,7-bisphosphatase